MTALETERCNLCKAYEPLTATKGECHRHPPSMPTPPQMQKFSGDNEWLWPVVKADGWCLEFVKA